MSYPMFRSAKSRLLDALSNNKGIQDVFLQLMSAIETADLGDVKVHITFSVPRTMDRPEYFGEFFGAIKVSVEER